jgi:hypothetical protein
VGRKRDVSKRVFEISIVKRIRPNLAPRQLCATINDFEIVAERVNDGRGGRPATLIALDFREPSLEPRVWVLQLKHGLFELLLSVLVFVVDVNDGACHDSEKNQPGNDVVNGPIGPLARVCCCTAKRHVDDASVAQRRVGQLAGQSRAGQCLVEPAAPISKARQTCENVSEMSPRQQQTTRSHGRRRRGGGVFLAV